MYKGVQHVPRLFPTMHQWNSKTGVKGSFLSGIKKVLEGDRCSRTKKDTLKMPPQKTLPRKAPAQDQNTDHPTKGKPSRSNSE